MNVEQLYTSVQDGLSLLDKRAALIERMEAVLEGGVSFERTDLQA